MLQPMKTFVALALVLASCGAAAQYKCVDSAGKTTFQQTPCAAAEKEQRLRIQGADAASPPASAPASQPVLTPEQRMLANIERERRQEERTQSIENLERQIGYLQDLIVRRNGQMSAELAALQEKKGAARNNLAGATWEQSISSEMQAVTLKYKTMNDLDLERLRQLRTELDGVKATKP